MWIGGIEIRMMDILTITWLSCTLKALTELHADYNLHQGLVLTEGDLECLLYHYLMNQAELSGRHPSKDDQHGETPKFSTTYVHSQVTWFKPDELSGFEVDLTICDPKWLEVENLDHFGRDPNKAYAYDGECLAIEVKFLRHKRDARSKSTEDYRKFRDDLIPAKLHNIRSGVYQRSTEQNIAFVSVVGCKTQEIFNKAKYFIGKQLSYDENPCPWNLFTCLFGPREIVWCNKKLLNYYMTHLELGTYERRNGR